MAAIPGQPTAAAAGTANSAKPVQNVSLWRFAGPRYWPAWLLLLWMRLTAALPWRAAIKVHKLLGRALPRLMPSRKRIVLRNLEICFPTSSPREIEALAKRHFENLGACLAEMAIAWFGSCDRLRGLFRIEGLEHLQAALTRGKGVMLFSGHFTTLEICAPMVKTMVPRYAFMFRPRHNALLNEMQHRGRQRAAHMSFANSDVRAMLRALRQNAAVWYAPDQAHRGSSSHLLSFFGEPAMTNTAASKLARLSGAPIVPFLFYRLPDDSGYVLRFRPPLVNFPSADVVDDTSRLVAILEDFIRECPEQYFWIHRKFKGRPGGLPDVYQRPRRRVG